MRLTVAFWPGGWMVITEQASNTYDPQAWWVFMNIYWFLFFSFSSALSYSFSFFPFFLFLFLLIFFAFCHLNCNVSFFSHKPEGVASVFLNHDSLWIYWITKISAKSTPLLMPWPCTFPTGTSLPPCCLVFCSLRLRITPWPKYIDHFLPWTAHYLGK